MENQQQFIVQCMLKSSAMENELNAAIHFIKFIKRTKTLTVTDPAFFATPENSRELISTFTLACTVKASLVHIVVKY